MCIRDSGIAVHRGDGKRVGVGFAHVVHRLEVGEALNAGLVLAGFLHPTFLGRQHRLGEIRRELERGAGQQVGLGLQLGQDLGLLLG